MDNRSKTIAKNTLFLYIRTAITMLISLYTSRVVLNALGETDFGVYNIVGGVVVLFSFINTSMTATTQRFLNFEIGSKKEDGVSRVFSISVNAHVLIAFFIVLLSETIGLWLMSEKINIPPGRENAAMAVYQISVLTTCISIIRCPFNASIIAYEKMSFFAWISIVESILKLIVAIIIDNDKYDRLITYAWLMLAISAVMTFSYWAFCHKKLKTIKYKFIKDYLLLKNMLLFSVWNLLGNAANVGVNQGIGIILNMFYGVLVNTAMGISNQLNALASAFVGNFQTAFMPQITKSYAAKDYNYLDSLIIKTSLFSFLLIYVISVPLYSNCEYILMLWLGTVPKFSIEFTQIILICTLLEALSGPLWMTAHATGKIRSYQIGVSIILLSSLGFCYLICKMNLGAPEAYLSKALVLLFATIFRLYYLKGIITFDYKKYFRVVVFRGFGLLLLGWGIMNLKFNFAHPFIKLIIDIILAIMVTIIIGIPGTDRRTAISFIRNKIHQDKSNVE